MNKSLFKIYLKWRYEMKIYFYSIGICVSFYTIKINDSFLMFLVEIINKISFKSDKQFVINMAL